MSSRSPKEGRRRPRIFNFGAGPTTCTRPSSTSDRCGCEKRSVNQRTIQVTLPVTNLSDLAHLRITDIDLAGKETAVFGIFNCLRAVRLGRGWLYAGATASLIGDLTELNPETRRAVFVGPFWNSTGPVQVGSDIPWVDGYWQPYQIAMIADPGSIWERAFCSVARPILHRGR